MAKHTVYLTVNRKDGKQHTQRFHVGSDKDDVVKMPKTPVDVKQRDILFRKVFFGHWYNGKLYDRNGEELELQDEWKQYAKDTHDKRFNNEIQAVHLALQDDKVYEDLSDEEQKKYIELAKKAHRKQFIENTLPKIKETIAKKEFLDRKKQDLSTNHTGEKAIKGRLNARLKKFNEEQFYIPKGYENTKIGKNDFLIEGKSLTEYKRFVDDISKFFQDPEEIQITYKVNNKVQNESLASLKQRLDSRYDSNNQTAEVSKRQITLKSGESLSVKLKPNEFPITIKDFKIETGLDSHHFNKEGASTVNYNAYKFKKV